MMIVAAARTPCAMTTGTGNFRSGGTAAGLRAPRVPAGTTMAGRWIGVYRMYKAPPAVMVPTVAHGATGRAAVPPERKFPVPVVIAHGVLAAATIVMVLITALAPGG